MKPSVVSHALRALVVVGATVPINIKIPDKFDHRVGAAASGNMFGHLVKRHQEFRSNVVARPFQL